MIFNWGLLKHPMNWVIVTLMLVFVGIAGHVVLSYFGTSAAQKPAAYRQPDNPSTTPVNLRPDGTFQVISAGA